MANSEPSGPPARRLRRPVSRRGLPTRGEIDATLRPSEVGFGRRQARHGLAIAGSDKACRRKCAEIVFTREELKEAIALYNRVDAQKLPPGLVVGCDLMGNEKVEVVHSISDQSTANSHSVTLGSAHLGARLVKNRNEK